MKTHVFRNLKFALKLVNSYHQVMSNADKQRYFMIFVKS